MTEDHAARAAWLGEVDDDTTINEDGSFRLTKLGTKKKGAKTTAYVEFVGYPPERMPETEDTDWRLEP